MIELATVAMLGRRLRDLGVAELPAISHVGVKVPQFSFIRLSGADPVLGVEMSSTGEVACLGPNFAEAFPTALEASGFEIPAKGSSVLITVGGKELKRKIAPLAKALRKIGFKIYATEHTAEVLRNVGVDDVAVLHKVREINRKPNIFDYIQNAEIGLVINIPMPNSGAQYSEILKDEYIIRRLAVEFNIPVVTNLELASALTKVLAVNNGNNPQVRSLNEYMDDLEWRFW